MPETAGLPAHAGVVSFYDGTGEGPRRGGPEPAPRKDHFIDHDGVVCAGRHFIVDLYGAAHLDDLERMERALRDAVIQAGATLLHIHLHHFTPNGGISGVAVLAESHISVHTWPENDYAAFDVFMCGDARPELTIGVFERAFTPTRSDVRELLRGVVDGG